MSDRYDSLACEAAAHERANAAEAEVERLRGLLTEAGSDIENLRVRIAALEEVVRAADRLRAEHKALIAGIGMVTPLPAGPDYDSKCAALGEIGGE